MVTQGIPEVYVHVTNTKLNSHTCMVISLYIQTSMGNNGHLQVVPIHTN